MATIGTGTGREKIQRFKSQRKSFKMTDRHRNWTETGTEFGLGLRTIHGDPVRKIKLGAVEVLRKMTDRHRKLGLT